MFLQSIWYVLIVGLFTAFAVLAGFDLGVGAIFPFAGRSVEERDALRRVSGPYWDGNQVWLIVGAGALFATFPPVYGAVLSAFYLPLIGALLALVLRAVSFGFSERDDDRRWVWDVGLFVGSALAPFLLGIVAGGVVLGLRLTAAGALAEGGASVVTGYSLLTGALAVSAFAMQGSAWAALNTSGVLRERCIRARRWSVALVAGFVALTAAATAAEVPDRLHKVLVRAPGVISLIVLVAGLILVVRLQRREQDRLAFITSSAVVAALVIAAATAVFPALVPARAVTGPALTLSNASSSELSLAIMLGIAAVGVPAVAAYTVFVYRLFAGRVDSDAGTTA
jgi:cytochrome d ubiquinol oxidase subunit II